MNKEEVIQLIHEQMEAFKQKFLTLRSYQKLDTPTEAYQVANKLYADTGGVADAFTYAATVSLDVTKGRLHTVTTTSAVGNATINASGKGFAGQELVLVITNDATAGRTITFGTNFLPSGTLVGTTSKAAVVTFVSNGTSFYEKSRTTGL
jgi:hypothetical protein